MSVESFASARRSQRVVGLNLSSDMGVNVKVVNLVLVINKVFLDLILGLFELHNIVLGAVGVVF